MLKRLLQWFKNLFRKEVTTDTFSSPSTPSVNTATVTNTATVNPFIAWKAKGIDLVWIQQWILKRQLTEAELVQAEQAGYRVVRDVPVGPAGPKDISAGDVLELTLANGEPYTVHYTLRPTTREARIHVFGRQGNQLLTVTDASGVHDAGTMDGYRAQVDGKPYTFSVTSLTGKVAVQLDQWR